MKRLRVKPIFVVNWFCAISLLNALVHFLFLSGIHQSTHQIIVPQSTNFTKTLESPNDSAPAKPFYFLLTEFEDIEEESLNDVEEDKDDCNLCVLSASDDAFQLQYSCAKSVLNSHNTPPKKYILYHSLKIYC